MASAAARNLDRSISDSSQSPPSGRSRRSVHRALGSGAVADVLLWRNPTATASVAGAATVFWILFELAGYSLLSLVANSLLLLVTILFFWGKSASLLNRPLPPLPKLEVSEELVGKVSDEARKWINHALSIARDIAIGRDRTVFFKVILVLWTASYIGGLFSFFTFVYIGVVLSLTIPAVYEKFQDPIDEKFCLAHSLLLKHFDNALSRTLRQSNKEKKIL
ncbi:reticulon-like protein B11 [Phalaenopsis equestris]|uniref:reticulon-like protein B11 n=1 Tax=Phalaenopsis equestris TaxID=78828 RepID=UPI0009E5F36B|nr:reticulon-like protein B11 [Phalaenopsis equestris]